MSNRNSQSYKPQTNISNQIDELKQKPTLYTEVDMIKVLDNYKKGVDYFNSYGIDNRAQTAKGSRRDGRPPISSTSSFWDYR